MCVPILTEVTSLLVHCQQPTPIDNSRLITQNYGLVSGEPNLPDMWMKLAVGDVTLDGEIPTAWSFSSFVLAAIQFM